MRTNEKAAPGGNRTRPEVENQHSESTPTRSTAQAQTVRVWRITRRPFRIGARGSDLPLAVFDRLDTFRQRADYVWVHAPDGRSLALVEGDYFERLRRAAYGHAPMLDPLDLDADYSAEDAA